MHCANCGLSTDSKTTCSTCLVEYGHCLVCWPPFPVCQQCEAEAFEPIIVVLAPPLQ